MATTNKDRWSCTPPWAEYRLVEVRSTMNLTAIRNIVYLKGTFNNIHLFELHPGCTTKWECPSNNCPASGRRNISTRSRNCRLKECGSNAWFNTRLNPLFADQTVNMLC